MRQRNLRAALLEIIGAREVSITRPNRPDASSTQVGLSILVAEDNIVNPKVVGKLLERWGCRPQTGPLRSGVDGCPNARDGWRRDHSPVAPARSGSRRPPTGSLPTASGGYAGRLELVKLTFGDLNVRVLGELDAQGAEWHGFEEGEFQPDSL